MHARIELTKLNRVLPAPRLPVRRYGHAMCGDSDRVYVYGGYFKNQVLGDLWVMDGIGRTWKEITVNQDEDLVPEPRAFCTLCCTNGKVWRRCRRLICIDWACAGGGGGWLPQCPRGSSHTHDTHPHTWP